MRWQMNSLAEYLHSDACPPADAADEQYSRLDALTGVCLCWHHPSLHPTPHASTPVLTVAQGARSPRQSHASNIVFEVSPAGATKLAGETATLRVMEQQRNVRIELGLGSGSGVSRHIVSITGGRPADRGAVSTAVRALAREDRGNAGSKASRGSVGLRDAEDGLQVRLTAGSVSRTIAAHDPNPQLPCPGYAVGL